MITCRFAQIKQKKMKRHSNFILFMFLRHHQMSAALREELKDVEPDYTDMWKCEDCGVEFEQLTTHNDKELGTIEVCESCLDRINEVNKQQK